MINALTGHNSSRLLAPRLDMGALWFFKAIYREQRDYLKELATAHALGELDLQPTEHKTLIYDLRKMHSVTKGLEALISAVYQPHIDRVMAEPDKRLEPKVIPLRSRVPKQPQRRRGRPKGSKNKPKPASTVTVTATAMPKRRPGRPLKHPERAPGEVRFLNAQGVEVKRRRNWPANTGKQAK